MSKNDESSGLAIFTDAMTGVPEPVRKTFFQVISDVLGGIAAIPVAKLKQIAQGIDDTTAARSMAATKLSSAAVGQAMEDPSILQLAAEIYLPTQVRKVKNRISVATSAAKHLATAAINASGKSAVPPDDDWLNAFLRFAEDASSDRLRDMFGRILSGQIVRPGAFGLATLRAVGELDQSAADDFTNAWSRSVGEAVDYSSEWQRGDGFSRWKRLAEAGLMAPTATAQFLPEFNAIHNGQAAWSPFHADGVYVLVYFQKHSTSKWLHIDFTRVGREIGSLLARPEYEENMRKAGSRLPQGGLTSIELHRPNKTSEIVWQASSVAASDQVGEMPEGGG